MSCWKIDPRESKARCGYTFFYKYLIAIYDVINAINSNNEYLCCSRICLFWIVDKQWNSFELSWKGSVNLYYREIHRVKWFVMETEKLKKSNFAEADNLIVTQQWLKLDKSYMKKYSKIWRISTDYSNCHRTKLA